MSVDMIPLVLAIFTASLLGSLHCVGMCGAFVAIASGGVSGIQPSAIITQSAYHLGRLLTYVAMGALAGVVGSVLNVAADLAGLQPVAAVLAGGMMIGFGVLTLLKLRGIRVALPGPPAFMRTWMLAGHRRAMDLSPVARSAAIGLLTTLLPCGWLYAFVITAAGTGQPLAGMLVMAVFWVGTLPVLIAVGASTRAALGWLGGRLPVVTCVVVIVAGVYTLLGRSAIDGSAVARAMTPTTAPTGPTVPDSGLVPPCCPGPP